MQLGTTHVAWKIRFQYQKLGVATCEHNKAYVHKTILFRFGKHWTSRWRDLGMWILHNQGNWWCNWHDVVQKNKVKESWVATIEQNKTYIYTRQSHLDLESAEQMDAGEICACEFYMIKVLSHTIGTMLVWKNKATESWSCKKHLSPTRDTYIHKIITFGFGKSTQHTNGTKRSSWSTADDKNMAKTRWYEPAFWVTQSLQQLLEALVKDCITYSNLLHPRSSSSSPLVNCQTDQ